jgi:hypothetical protein
MLMNEELTQKLTVSNVLEVITVKKDKMCLFYVKLENNALQDRKNLSLVLLETTVLPQLLTVFYVQKHSIVQVVLRITSNAKTEHIVRLDFPLKNFVHRVLLEMEILIIKISQADALNVMLPRIQLLTDQENVYPVLQVMFVLAEQQPHILRIKILKMDINAHKVITAL